ncbi:BON1-associated protein 2-like [Olea europaea var. sylvestris]|uniref:BON1-associated 2-like n=1 Tax=Olea europaea subsp. europaea TaxID=158383 RepID=A0A8S0QTS5_OLEEU|nr:BON1-associated protein 2-like [Olea europaea var. sylvestris]CAA2969102.1 BON1-associated 2-like [Olea europaea subsp. europaea]
MEKISSKTIEITVISGEDLCVNRRQRVKKNAFVIVQTDSSRATKMDTDGGSYPVWNEKFVMELPMHARFINVEVQCKAFTGGNNLIGTARIPVSDFSGGYLPVNYLSFLSYRLRDGNGEKNGIINLSVKVIGPENTSCAASCSTPWTAVPVDNKFSGGIVTGIPVPYRY